MKRLLGWAVAAVLLSGCLKTNEDNRTCTYDACALKAPAAEIESVKAYLTQNNINATQHCSGMFYAIDSAGTGKTPTPCALVAIRYKGMLTNGSVFDQSANRAELALSQLIPGWINALPLIKEGGGIRLYIPPTLGYGNRDVRDNAGNVLIPANSVLIFEVRLDGVVNP